MGGGGLRVGGGTDRLATAAFTYNMPSWKPEVNYSSSTGTGNLTIRQSREVHSIGGGRTNEWEIRLNRDIPLEITSHQDVGDANLNLGGLTLRHVEMQMDAGNLDLDLRGSPKNSYDVRIRRLAGDTTVHLPSSVGVEVLTTGRVSDIEVANLNEDGHRYYNNALGESKLTIHLDIQGGLGEIRLLSDQ
jgi:hypothetical protein